MRRFRWRFGALVCMLLVSMVGPLAQAAPGPLCFAETGYCIEGRFREYWEDHGGLPVFGYPISSARNEINRDTGQTHQTQWFERNRFELHPQNARPYDVLLGRLGDERLIQQGRNWQSFPKGSQAAGCDFFAQTSHTLCEPFRNYWKSHGLEFDGRAGFSHAESLALFGLPLSEPQTETNAAGHTVTTQWFERARFEHHPNNAPEYRVLLGLLGNEVRGHGGQPPATPGPTAQPTTTPIPTTTPAPTAQPTTIPNPTATPAPQSWLDAVNRYRALAGVPPVTEDATLNNNCFQHARYMAENRDLTHDQNPSLPWASPEGQICAQRGNAWIGGGTVWDELDPIDGWMESVGHRLWLLYPTTPTFGYGFFRANNGTSAAALDVLSKADMGRDASYTGWPIRYPASGQSGIPPYAYTITLMWPYFDAAPTLSSASLRTASGAAIAHQATTELPVGHKGISIKPQAALSPRTTYVVSVSGNYKGAPFSYEWSFTTGQ